MALFKKFISTVTYSRIKICVVSACYFAALSTSAKAQVTTVTRLSFNVPLSSLLLVSPPPQRSELSHENALIIRARGIVQNGRILTDAGEIQNNNAHCTLSTDMVASGHWIEFGFSNAILDSVSSGPFVRDYEEDVVPDVAENSFRATFWLEPTTLTNVAPYPVVAMGHLYIFCTNVYEALETSSTAENLRNIFGNLIEASEVPLSTTDR